ncbi:hypothetical protein I7X12_06750 [Halosimplex litoreum]|uniref:Uncharacterized protein n=1 Tax=Halosimplex litoreum TaxID=1198301 RepID=A0A7T3G108_9EURY|nr:hypothetical protein [Halosimplex litoreum]QPV64307.1 hypothetical protein I7X12_06750 [Halosimplex litoreum]
MRDHHVEVAGTLSVGTPGETYEVGADQGAVALVVGAPAVDDDHPCEP